MMSEICGLIGLAGMAAAFLAGWVIAYVRGVEKQLELGREILDRLDGERQRYHERLEAALDQADQRW